jgi:hypothetical protein
MPRPVQRERVERLRPNASRLPKPHRHRCHAPGPGSRPGPCCSDNAAGRPPGTSADHQAAPARTEGHRGTPGQRGPTTGPARLPNNNQLNRSRSTPPISSVDPGLGLCLSNVTGRGGTWFDPRWVTGLLEPVTTGSRSCRWSSRTGACVSAPAAARMWSCGPGHRDPGLSRGRDHGILASAVRELPEPCPTGSPRS